MLLQDKVALVTGAGRGIGRGIALRFAAEGAKVAVVERSVEHGQAVCDAIETKFPGRAMLIEADVSDKAQVHSAVEAVAGRFGGLDILVNNAALFTPYLGRMNPLGRMGDPEADIAPVAVFLASEMSRYVTGQLINVDGGQHLPRFNSKPADVAALERGS